jgi:hypothetical protein
MAKILRLRDLPTDALKKRKAALLSDLSVPGNAIRASCVRQFVTCGKSNCRCRDGRKHGPFDYLVQCLKRGRVQKFLLKGDEAKRESRTGIAAYRKFEERLEELSQINTELIRRGLSISDTRR